MTTTRHRIDKESVLPFRASKCEEPREFVGGVRCQPRQPYVRGKMSGSAVGRLCEPCSLVRDPRFNPFSARRSLFLSLNKGDEQARSQTPMHVEKRRGKCRIPDSPPSSPST